MAENQPTNPPFESAMERLQQLVEQMESGTLPLEEMLERYEEGIRLVQFCSEKLVAAEKRIEIVTRNAAGNPQIADFEAVASAQPASAPSKSAKSHPSAPGKSTATGEDDISLF